MGILRIRDASGKFVPVPCIRGEPGENGKTPSIGSNGNWWIDDNDSGIFAGPTSCIFVGAHGCQYTTVTEAVAAAKLKATATNRICIVVMPGTYTGGITLLPNPGIDIIAPAGAEIVADAAYPEAALHTVGTGTFVNLTLSTVIADSYALHIEALENETIGQQRFIGCSFAGTSAGIGIGEGNGFYQIFERCTFSGERSVYLHNNPNVASEAKARFNNCIFQSPVHIQNYTSNPNGKVEMLFIGCVATDITYTTGALGGEIADAHYIPYADSAVWLNALSAGNSNNGLNYGKGVVAVSATGIFLENGLGIIPMDTQGYTFTASRILKADAYTPVSGAAAYASGNNLTISNTEKYAGVFFVEGTLTNAR